MVLPWKEKDFIGRPVKAPDKVYSVDRKVLYFDGDPVIEEKVVWEKQTGLEFFNKVGYARRERRADWDLPGKGKSYADCGTVKARGCDNYWLHSNGKVLRRLYKHNCRRKSCPVCFEGWACSQAERALIRLASYVVGPKKVKELIFNLKMKFRTSPKRIFHEALVIKLEKMIKEGSKGRSGYLRPIHVVLSPPQHIRWFDMKEFLENRSLGYKIAKKHGLYAGSAIPHPYRLRCKKCKATIPDYQKQCLKCGSSKFEWFFSAHWHYIGFGFIHGTAQGYKEHAWVVKNLGIRNSVYWTYQYILSHAGVSKFHTVTWFGSLAYNKLKHVPKLGSVREFCPECGEILRPLKWCYPLDRPPPQLVYHKDPYKNDSWEDPSEWRCF